MRKRFTRILWLICLLVMIGHTMILVAGAVGMYSHDPFTGDLRDVPTLTRIALHIDNPGWMFLALNAALNLPVIIAHARSAMGRKFKPLIVWSIVVRVLLMMICAVATAYLAFHGRVRIEGNRFSASWRMFEWNDVAEQVGAHLLLSIPLLVFALRWIPMMTPQHRRRRKWERTGCCTSCGYDLRGHADGRCPECGTTESNQA